MLCNHLSSLTLFLSLSLSDSVSDCLTLWHSLSTSSVLIGPHPLAQDSLSFSSSIISCNVLNLESPSKPSASLHLCLFLCFSHFCVAEIANCSWFEWPGPTIHLMEMASPVPGSDLTALSIETVLWKKDLWNKIPRCSENWEKNQDAPAVIWALIWFRWADLNI